MLITNTSGGAKPSSRESQWTAIRAEEWTTIRQLLEAKQSKSSEHWITYRYRYCQQSDKKEILINIKKEKKVWKPACWGICAMSEGGTTRRPQPTGGIRKAKGQVVGSTDSRSLKSAVSRPLPAQYSGSHGGEGRQEIMKENWKRKRRRKWEEEEKREDPACNLKLPSKKIKECNQILPFPSTSYRTLGRRRDRKRKKKKEKDISLQVYSYLLYRSSSPVSIYLVT
ncbi:hypothetical protein L873DRAFT_217509 [Choiromyces venosus 120613-1]|uniref:Uncharacterized protein n=1 Tax=Choiromyces venosus 120613-1 TaxID=1336337 RepID=A0A3N4J6W9_9PEZI|nr:hypothetical protein L873DRAFT_217509 [Choiromyces venosus 120613-1]